VKDELIRLASHVFQARIQNFCCSTEELITKSGPDPQGLGEVSTQKIQEMEEQEKVVTIEPTKWPKGFNPKAHEAICVDCKKP
jgi:hypothetical protein